jgi:dethiobiotin synthetase
MATLFVTGSGTDIGKTFVSCRLLAALPRELRVRAVKPVVTGFPGEGTDPKASDTAIATVPDPAVAESDTGRLLRAQGLPLNRDTIVATSPWRFRAPLSADMAAAREERRIDFNELVAFCRAPARVDLNLVEGIGGVMAPLDDQHTVIDWIAALEARTLLVVGSYLGALSHALTAHAALNARGIETVAIVISQSLIEPVPTTETAASLSPRVGATPVLILPRDENASAAELAALLRRTRNLG